MSHWPDYLSPPNMREKLKVGDTWYTKHKSSRALIEMKVSDLTDRTVLLCHPHELYKKGAGTRYAIDDINFIEKVKK